jgi:hypothetical protein
MLCTIGGKRSPENERVILKAAAKPDFAAATLKSVAAIHQIRRHSCRRAHPLPSIRIDADPHRQLWLGGMLVELRDLIDNC